MPVDFEMFYSASPPVFSPFTEFTHYGTYNPYNFRDFRKALGNINSFNPTSKNGTNLLRSCLVVRGNVPKLVELSTNNNNTDKSKKHVCFADDRGFSLTQVRIMHEASDCPPNWSDAFLEKVTGGVKPQVSVENLWELAFPQPASDYLEFRNKLDRNCICLENVIIKDGDQNIMGTIKVKNLSFKKEVGVRVTFDLWKSFQDVIAQYVPNGNEGGTSLYDTFSFVFPIKFSAAQHQAIEFCVKYKTPDREYWDNNDSKNYRVNLSTKKEKVKHVQRYYDAVTAPISSWAEFASWNHLITEGPYW